MMFAVLEPTLASGGPSPSEKVPVKESRRRDKTQMSCTLCRLKKLKCDRQKPCTNCTKRRQPESCDYVKQVSSAAHCRPSKLQGTTNVHERVEQLEGMVRALLASHAIPSQDAAKAEKSSPATSPLSSITDSGFTPSPVPLSHNQMDPSLPDPSVGKFTGVHDQVNFVGSEHWEAILEDITALKIDLETPKTSDMVDFKPFILFAVNNVSRTEIISSIPPRQICDMLISRWYRTMDMGYMIIHMPTFMKEYEQFLKEPDKTPLMWIGLFFSILSMASYFYTVAGEEIHNMPEQYTSMGEMGRHFRYRTAQCLAEVNYLRPRRYTVETLCFYYAIETFEAKDSTFGAYVLLGIVIKVAMRLGYHRDPSHYPSISPFDGEMRRRVWTVIFEGDLKTSAQVGLPRAIREGEADTAEPKNLLDADLDEAMTELPYPRPSTEATPMAYVIFKVRLSRHLGSIVDHMNSIKLPSYDEVMRLDLKLMETHATLPTYLNMRPLSLSITDDADLIVRRSVLEVCFQKSRCVLHRKYLIPGNSNIQFRYSRTVSVDAAMQLLNVQCMFHEASQPGGQLFSERWRSIAILSPDYALAAMILCLDLTWSMKMGQGLLNHPEDEIEVTWPKSQRLQILKSSHHIWCKSSKISTLAAKVARALSVMLKDLDPTYSAVLVSTELVFNPISIPDASQQPTYSEESMGGFSKLDFGVQLFVGSSTLDVTSGTLDAEMNFDWGLWDNQFQIAPVAEDDYRSLTFQ